MKQRFWRTAKENAYTRNPSLRQKDERRQFTRRALLLGGAQAGMVSLLYHQLHKIQLVEGQKFRTLADENRISVNFSAPVRGLIKDRYGEVLAGNRENFRVLIQVMDPDELAETLSKLASFVKIDDTRKKKILKRARISPPYTHLLVRDKLNWSEYAVVNAQLPDLPGVLTEIGYSRFYNKAESFAHITGVVGAPDRIALVEKPQLHLPGMLVGRNGIEAGFEQKLHGHPGIIKSEVNARGKRVRLIEEQGSIAGTDIQLTPLPDLQEQVFNHLKKVEPAAAVVMDIQTGEILVMSSSPNFNLNDMLPPIPTKKWEAIRDHPGRPLEARAYRGQYPPGSTFKMVTALAGLESGAIGRKTKFRCYGALSHGGHKYRCWNRSGHGRVDLVRSLRESCDVFFYETALKTGIQKIAKAARVLGLGQAYKMGLPNLKSGLVPDPDWKRFNFSRHWYPGETILASIGQGYVLATPLQLAVMTARIASGKMVKPRVVPKNDDDKDFAPLPFKAEHLKIVRRGMFEAVNYKSGTAKKAAYNQNGMVVAGKTGTAQVISTGNRRIRANSSLPKRLRDHALFVGYMPVKNPKYAVSVIVENGGGGGKVAAPLAREILHDTYLAMQKDAAKLKKLEADSKPRNKKPTVQTRKRT